MVNEIVMTEEEYQSYLKYKDRIDKQKQYKYEKLQCEDCGILITRKSMGPHRKTVQHRCMVILNNLVANGKVLEEDINGVKEILRES